MTNYDHFIVHVPHSSIEIPGNFREAFLISEKDLWKEQCRLTDAFCDELFSPTEYVSPNRLLTAPVSRIVCDVERFRDDSKERMSWRGMGLMYTRTTFGRKLRKNDNNMRNTILSEIYDPHHERLTKMVDGALEKYERCTLLDGHSFHSKIPFSFESIFYMPDVCIGTDSFHTPPNLCKALVDKTKELGYSVRVNSPFAGSITPLKHYQKDKRVTSVMIELNRRLYLNESNMTKSSGYEQTRILAKELTKIVAEW